MSYFRTGASALLLTTALTSAAWADLTAEQVWEQIAAQYTETENADVTYDSFEKNGDVLTISNVVMTSSTVTDDDLLSKTVQNTVGTLGDMVLTEQSDGSVRIETAEQQTIQMTFQETIGTGDAVTVEESSVTIELAMENADIVASEADNDGISYDFSADMMAIEMTELEDDDAPSIESFTGVKLSDIAGTQTTTLGGDLQNSDSDFTIGNVSYALDLANGDDVMQLNGEIADVTLNAIGTLPLQIDAYNFEDGFADSGIEMALDMTAGAASNNQLITSDGNVQLKNTSSSEGTTFKFDFSPANMLFDFMLSNASQTMSTADLPFPVSFEANEIGFNMAVPLAKTDSGDAKFGIIFDGIEISDGLWSMFDPQQILPRGPLTARAQVSGAMKVMLDIFDEDAMKNTDDVPMLPLNARIDEFQITGAGVDISAEASFDFDHSDLTLFEGMPAPIGDATITAEGVTGLVNNLVKMGLAEQNEVNMQMMVLGMFTETIGEDKVRSNIELKEGGQIFANGQRVR